MANGWCGGETTVMDEERLTEIVGHAQAAPGDVVAIHGHHVGEPEQLGEILDVLGEGEHVHYRVCWDDGHESLFYPGSDATIRHSVRRPS
jgi:hypothetical protein